jgi:Na+-transporting methylmalonyl-CoA/oxaloacetate decarboxylase gamma subunit
MSNAELSNGIIVGVGGLVVVFLGLVLIEIVIHFFNRYVEKKSRKKPSSKYPNLVKNPNPYPSRMKI